jgi:enoyl-CoA hydratase/carnithine racemase
MTFLSIIEDSITFEALDYWNKLLCEDRPLYLHMRNCSGMNSEESFKQSSNILQAYGEFILRLQQFSHPICCVSEGYVLGGSMAWLLQSDIHVTFQNTKFKFPERFVNGIPSLVSSCAKRKLNISKLKFKMLSGETIVLEEALEMGLVDKYVQRIEDCHLLFESIVSLYPTMIPTQDPYKSAILLGQFLFPVEQDIPSKENNHYGRLVFHSLSNQKKLAILYFEYNRLLNSIDLGFSKWLRDSIITLQKTPYLTGVILCHGDQIDHFCIGLCTLRFIPSLKIQPYYQTVSHIFFISETIALLRSLECPILGLIDGSLMGGGVALALQCDLLWATQDTKMKMGTLSRGAPCISELSSILRDKIGQSALFDLYIEDSFKDSNWLKTHKLISRLYEGSYSSLIDESINYLSRVQLSPNISGIRSNTLLFRKKIDWDTIYKEVIYFVNCLYDKDKETK